MTPAECGRCGAWCVLSPCTCVGETLTLEETKRVAALGGRTDDERTRAMCDVALGLRSDERWDRALAISLIRKVSS